MVDYSAYHWAKKAQYWAESIGHALIYRGSVATYADLPSSDQKIGDMYNVLADGSNYAWDGTAWDALSGIVDLSAYRTSEDQDLIDAGKQPTLTTGTGINISSANVISVTSPTLTNVSTGTSSLSVLGAATVDSAATCIGVDSTAGTNGTSLGRSANSVNGGLAIGTNSKASGSWSTAVGNGNSLSNTAEATASGAIALGHNAHATASNAVQIFEGTNSTANSLQVKTYELLDTSTGLIPDARISTNIARTSDIKDATITITQGGVTKGSFTTNQSTADTIALDAASLPSQSGQSGKFLTTNGTTASWSVPKTNDLFDYKWTDYELTDQCWLRGDSYSWQDGTVYSDAYNHLVDDIDGKTATTETINGTTVTYYLADDGHKIVDVSDVSAIETVYSSTGVAWYYVLDTANTRFKLPRENPAREELIQVIRAKGDGISLGLTNGTNNAGFEPVSGLGVTAIQQAYGLNVGDSVSGSTGLTNGIAVGITIDSTKSGIISDMTDSTSVYKGKKYLYFYVGQFSQSATEQTAGLNAELFNGKMDLDMSNMNPSQTAKQTIIRLGEPDWSAGVDIEVPVQATPYVCPSDGIYCFCFMPASSQSNLFVNGVKTAVCMRNSSSNNANKASSSAVLQKNDSIYFDVGTTTANTFASTFYPLKGVTNA